MTSRLGTFAFRHRWLVLFIWVGAIVAGGLAAGPMFNSITNNPGFDQTESGRGFNVIKDSSDRGNDITAVYENLDPNNPQTAAAISATAEELRRIDGVKEVAKPIPAENGHGIALATTLNKYDSGDDAAKKTADATVENVTDELRELDKELGGAQLGIGGSEIMDREVNDQVEKDLANVEKFSMPITLLVLIFVFGGVIAAGLPILAAVATTAGAFGVLYAFTSFVDLDPSVMSTVTVLGLGLSIDYGLLLVARYREELAKFPAIAGKKRRWSKESRLEAVRLAWGTAGRTIMFSALTVIVALSGLLMFDLAPMQAAGAAGISVALVAMLAALTFTAVLLGFLSRWVKPARKAVKKAKEDGFATHYQRYHGGDSPTAEKGMFARLARFTQKRPVVVTVVTASALVLAGAPLATATIKIPRLDSLPTSIESVRVQHVLAEDFGQIAEPAVQVVARTDPQALDEWAADYRNDSAVATIESAKAMGDNLAMISLGVHGDAQGEAAQDLVERVRADRPAGVQSWVTGDAAVLVDINDQIIDDLPLALTITIAGMIVLLFLFTGSLMVPIKAVLMNVISLGATYGVLVAVFEHGWGSSLLDTQTTAGLSPFVAVMSTTFAFALSMDYEVFLLGRIKEHVDQGHSTDAAVRFGLQRSGRIITSAALLMLIVFGAFVAGKVGDIEQIGLALFVAILIDATVVRCVLVPATMTLLGRWNWWAPKPLKALHARFGIREHVSVASTTPATPEPAKVLTHSDN